MNKKDGTGNGSVGHRRNYPQNTQKKLKREADAVGRIIDEFFTFRENSRGQGERNGSPRPFITDVDELVKTIKVQLLLLELLPEPEQRVTEFQRRMRKLIKTDPESREILAEVYERSFHVDDDEKVKP